MTAPEISHYNYDPSIPAAALFGALYLLAAFATLFQWIKYRAWVWFVMVFAAFMEGIGYLLRIWSIKNVTKKPPYVAQFALIVLAPVLMAAGFYVVFGRIVYHVVPPAERKARVLWVSPRFVTPIFVTSDVICLFLQLVGAIKVSSINPTDPNASEEANKGRNIALIGVVLQLVVFGFFCITAARFNFTSRAFLADYEKRINAPTDAKYVQIDDYPKKVKKNWQQLLLAVNIGCGLILVRTIYRTVDFSLGRKGYTEEHEWCAYVFDALPILPCVAMFIFIHPGKYLPYLSFRLPKHARQAAHDNIEMGQSN
ncbi:RTA1 protein-like protein [Coleophoma crateriformis]|uniref:RTA1 protein-like protein n=1 Tax=Coleophoma crateriformis TaxID=565419 RepID=A0A3D8QUA7_9HELO|nr:RTA1 protein-like protein [Coleophoma crateriformis]